MDINILREKVERIFFELGFKNEIIGVKQYRYLVYNNCYCKITYLNSREAFVIECADNAKDASNGVTIKLAKADASNNRGRFSG